MRALLSHFACGKADERRGVGVEALNPPKRVFVWFLSPKPFYQGRSERSEPCRMPAKTWHGDQPEYIQFGFRV